MTDQVRNRSGHVVKLPMRNSLILQFLVPVEQYYEFVLCLGPDPATTIIAEEILMNFVHNKEESEKDVEDKSAIQRLAESNKGVVKCRICKEDHWTTMCPYKDTLGPLRDSLAGTEKDEGGQNEGGKLGEPGKPGSGMPGSSGGPGGAGAGPGAAGTGGKYVPPSRRGAEGRIGESMPDRKGRGKLLASFKTF